MCAATHSFAPPTKDWTDLGRGATCKNKKNPFYLGLVERASFFSHIDIDMSTYSSSIKLKTFFSFLIGWTHHNVVISADSAGE